MMMKQPFPQKRIPVGGLIHHRAGSMPITNIPAMGRGFYNRPYNEEHDHSQIWNTRCGGKHEEECWNGSPSSRL